MLSHNNWRETVKQQEPKQQRFTIKKLTVGVASVLLGFTFAETTTASADTDVNTENHLDNVTEHNQIANSASISTLQQSATSTTQQQPASAANPVGDVKTSVADNYEAAVSSAVKQENQQSVAQNNPDKTSSANSVAAPASSSAKSETPSQQSSVTGTQQVKENQTQPINYAVVFASLANNATEQAANTTTVTDWNGLQSALNNTSVNQVNVQGTIYAYGDATVNHNVTINGVDGASINFGNSVIKGTSTWGGINLTFNNLTLTSTSSTGAVDFSQTNNKNTVTFNNVNAHGASLYNGGGNTDVYIRGNVTSDFDGSAAKPTVAQLNNALGSYPTANINNWQNANIVADNVYVDQGATLTLTRSVVGDGIDIVAGNKAYKNSSNAMGNVNVGVNASLNITLMNGTQQNLRASEQATNIENASAAIRAYRNGSFTTGDSAQVNLNVGHGRGIVFDEPFGGSTSIQLQGDPETNWYNNRAATNYRDYDHNEFKLGNSTKFYLHGRDGVLLGNRATMITGENSQLTFDNGGNGSGLTVDAYARVEISPHSVVLMHSDGKNHSGVWNGGNYIGLGEDGHFTVDHDATFRYILVNRNTLTANGTNVTNFYDDNFNITSVKSSSHPLVTIGDNAVFDGQSDYRNIFGEILSFSYNNAPAATTMNIHGARYINFQKYEATTPGAFQNVTTYDPDGKHTGNLFYSWPHNTWTVNGNTYNAYKWDDEYYAGKEDTYDATNAETIKNSIDAFTRDASQTWSGITDLNLDYNMHERVGGYVNNDATMSNHGVAFGAEAHGFDPEYSQRVALVATNIPTEDTQTEQQKTDYDVILKYNKDLPAGTVKVTQQGVDGLVRKTETTYYNVNGATGEKTLDTSKGGYNIVMDADGNIISRTPNNNPGYSTTIAEINKMVPEIIEVGPQKVTLNYVDKTSGKTLKTTTVLGNPIKTGTDNVVEFDKDGNVIPNAITEATFTDNGQTVAEIVKGYTDQGMTVTDNTLATAIKDGTAQYDVKGVTRDSLSNQQAIPANGPVYEIDLNEAVKQGSITVTYYDETTGQTMTQYTYNSGEENVGTPITYSTAETIKTLENQGYVLVNDGFTSADVTDITAGSHSYVVTVKHGIEDVNKNNPHGLEVTKTVTRTVNYTVNGKASDQLPEKTESADFTATGYWDKVLKQLVDVVNGQIVTENGQVKQGQLTWTADGSTKDEATLNGYVAPSLDGYHVDAVSATSAGQNVTDANVTSDGTVKNITVTSNSNNINVNINLASNGTKIVDQQNIPGSQTVKFEDENGNELAKAVVDHTDFTYSGNVVDAQTGKVITQGKWNQESHQFSNVKVPVIKGYVADTATAGGLTATIKNPNVTQTVIYHPVGKIIPVDPSGKPIPNVPQPPYTNDPKNPTKVTPDESVPDIPGYVPSVPTVTPNDPTKNTTVVYNNTETAIVNYVDQSENDKLITTSGDLTGPSGTKIDYSTAATIKQLEDQGYVFVSSNYPVDATFDDDMGKTQVYTVVMKHGTTTYNPEKPATPGEPINPNYPDGPKVTKEDADYSKDVTSTVHYEGAGEKTPANNVQNAQWTRSITVDRVTGKIINTTEWQPNKTTYDSVKTPVVEGYHADKAIVPAQKVTMDDLTTTVTYYPNGHIIPTTPDDKEIPNAPHPQYPTSPNDPTTVTPNEPVPEIPGYTPTVPTVTPTDPGKDTPVVYKQIQQADLTIVDQDNDNKQIEVSGITTAFMDQGDQGTAITFDGIDSAISSLEKIGYVYVSSTFKQGDLFDNQDNQPQRYIIVMKHGIDEVNKNNPHGLEVTKTVTRTVNYTVNGKASDQLPEKTESADFTATGYWDKVLKQLVDVVNGQIVTENGQVKQGQLTWTADGSTKDEATLNGYPAPSLDGYHVDAVSATSAGQNVTADNVADDGAVKNITVTSNSNNINVNINLASNGTKIVDQQDIPGSQTVKFEDENGNELAKAVVDHTDFTYSGNIVDAQTGKVITQGKWNQESHQFGTVTVPVIKGYVADSDTAGGLTATIKDPNVTQTIIYHQVGKIIPVDPSGKPIPNVPQPPYTNDPNNPTKVTPDESVPDIPGYVPSVPTVTPNDPTKNTTVVYNNTETAIVNYVDQSENDKLITTSGDLTGPSGSKIDYSTAATIKQLEDQGYVFVSSNYPVDATFDNDMGKTQVYTVVMKHGTTTYNPEKPATPGEPINPNYPDGPKVTKEDADYSKDVTSTVHYEGAGEKTPANNVQNAQWTRSITVDRVTGKIINTTEWQPNKTDYQPVKTPVIEGYHADKAIVPAQKVTMDDLTTTVTYYPNGHIIPTTPDGKEIPNAPHPQYPTSPNDPTTVTPNEPVPEIPGYTPTVPTVTPTDPGKDTPVVYNNTETAIVNYVDQSENDKLITTSGDLTGPSGSKIDYSTAATIKQLEDQGYVFVSSNYPVDATFDDNMGKTQVYTVVMKHGTTTYNPGKPATPGEPINPNYPDGPKVTKEDVDYSKDVKFTVNYVGAGAKNPQPNVQNAQWTRSITVDNITGKIISTTEWQPNKTTYDSVKTPVVEGYHADKAEVSGPTVTMTDETATVTYAPNGHIIPVDKNGTPIPGVDHPQYPTNPNDPTGVTPNEQVPEIPGYTPEVPTVTPENPGTDTDVPYTKNPIKPQPTEEQTAIVNYVDQSENDKLITTSGQLKGTSGTKIDYSTAATIKQLEDQGYVFVSSNYPADATFDDTPHTTQVFTVVMKHGYAPVGPNNPHEPGTPVNPDEPNGPKWPAKDNYTKDYTLTIHYSGAGNETPANNVQTSTWTRTVTVDRVTGAIIPDGQFTTTWTPNEARYKEVNVPVVKGYVADKAVAGGQKTVQENITENVTYTKVGNIVPVTPDGNPILGVPEVPYTNDPNNPTKVIPNEPVPDVPGYTPEESTVTPTSPTQDTPVVYTKPTPVTPTTPTTPSKPVTPVIPETPKPTQPAAPESKPISPAGQKDVTTPTPVMPQAVSEEKTVTTPNVEEPAITPVAMSEPVSNEGPRQGKDTLPQTGNSQNDTSEILGLVALGLTGILVGGATKRRRKD